MTVAGQVIVGGWVSLTVTVKAQVGPALEVQVTVVVPFGKNEPDAGEQVMVPHDPLGCSGNEDCYCRQLKNDSEGPCLAR